jgi:hypothetical protein
MADGHDKTISGWIEFNERDAGIIQGIFGELITEVRKSDFPGWKVGRFENAPETVLDVLTDYWGQFEWTVD